jgi:cytoskeletal protein CcmA (bactofilin family)
MSDPRQVSDPNVVDSPLNQAFTSSEFADFLPDTSRHFEAWLENLKPALETAGNPALARPLAVDNTPAPGELRFEGTLRIDCYVTGSLRSLTGTLIVSETAEVESDVAVATAIIDGFLRGDINASERVELQSHARVIGNIESPALTIQPGAVFEGRCDFPASLFNSDTHNSGPDYQQTSPRDASLSRSQDCAADERTGEAEAAEEPCAAVAAAC